MTIGTYVKMLLVNSSTQVCQNKQKQVQQNILEEKVGCIALEKIDLHLFTDQWKKSCLWVVVYFKACN